MKCAKSILIALTSLLVSIGFTTNANAGSYAQENGVRIYRSGPTPAQKTIINARRQAVIAHEEHIAHQKAFAVQQANAVKKSYVNGYKSGHEQGYQQGRHAQISKKKRAYKRRRYGRRYTTDLYGSRNGAYGRYARHRHRHRHTHR